ncbi:hypothetical protein M8C21_019939 [Ambrosia artemisiifolia]|uniref:Uncharacterized protein n=1 Tax=Ambrosia artemisiifolia TaxID=4212 RepID=A0AAD5GJW3_AMBAR|nr:hypothetical protein M8C21_019939 [Ambrosia artemisiifolia]
MEVLTITATIMEGVKEAKDMGYMLFYFYEVCGGSGYGAKVELVVRKKLNPRSLLQLRESRIQHDYTELAFTFGYCCQSTLVVVTLCRPLYLRFF